MTEIFEIQPQKAVMRLNINSAMIGVIFFMLTFILSIGKQASNHLVIAELIIAVPLLYVSVLAYSKAAYWKENQLWDVFAWLTGNLGNNIVLDAVGLMVVSISVLISLAYYIMLIFLMAVYSIINCKYNPKHIRQKILKLGFFLAIIILGGILPALFMH